MDTLVALSPNIGTFARPIIVFVVLLGLALGLRRAPLAGVRIVTWFAVAVPVVGWLLLMMWIGQTDLYQSFPLAQRAATLVPPVLWLAVLMHSRRIAAVLDAMPCPWLIGLQFYRVLGGVFLLQWAVGRTPGAFAVPAGTGDLLTGLLALPVAIYVSKRASHWRLVGYAWNLFGLADFAMALSIAIFFAPPGLRYPLTMIPTFGVPLGIVLHVLSLWQLSRTQTAATSAPAVHHAVSRSSAY